MNELARLFYSRGYVDPNAQVKNHALIQGVLSGAISLPNTIAGWAAPDDSQFKGNIATWEAQQRAKAQDPTTGGMFKQGQMLGGFVDPSNLIDPLGPLAKVGAMAAKWAPHALPAMIPPFKKGLDALRKSDKVIPIGTQKMGKFMDREKFEQANKIAHADEMFFQKNPWAYSKSIDDFAQTDAKLTRDLIESLNKERKALDGGGDDFFEFLGLERDQSEIQKAIAEYENKIASRNQTRGGRIKKWAEDVIRNEDIAMEQGIDVESAKRYLNGLK
jgi:hypothetical protein